MFSITKEFRRLGLLAKAIGFSSFEDKGPFISSAEGFTSLMAVVPEADLAGSIVLSKNGWIGAQSPTARSLVVTTKSIQVVTSAIAAATGNTVAHGVSVSSGINPIVLSASLTAGHDGAGGAGTQWGPVIVESVDGTNIIFSGPVGGTATFIVAGQPT